MVSNAEVARFIEFAEEARATLPAALDEQYVRSAFNVDSAAVWSHQGLRDLLWQRIRQAVVRTAGSELTDLRAMRAALFRRSRFLDDGSKHYLLPATILYGVNERYFAPLSDKRSWLTAIRAATALYALSHDYRPDGGNERDIIVTDAARRWVHRGYRIRLDGLQFEFEDDEDSRAALAVDEMARRIGGHRLIHFALKVLRDNGHFRDDRFSIPRSASTIPDGATISSIPFGYLLQLAARHLRNTPASVPRELLLSFIDHITDLVALLDVESFSFWDKVFTDREQLPRYIQVATVADFCLNLRQIRPNDALHMLEHLFQWVPEESMRERHGWTVSEALRVAKACLKPANKLPVNVLFETEEIGGATRLPKHVLAPLLASFTHRTDTLNTQFMKPTDARASNFYSKPLVWQPGGKVLLTAPSVSSVGFIEALMEAARMVDGQADNKTGLAMESMLADSFRRSGIEPTAASLKYRVGKQHFDCDLLVETEDTLLLFEIKKKSLSNPAMAGSALDALIDLCFSMVKAQTQLLHHELQLSREGGLIFENGVRVLGRNRRIEKIAVTLLDWGGTHDRVVSDTILKQLAGSSIDIDVATTSWQKSKLIECNKLLAILTERAAQLSELKGEEPFLDCTFLGVPQMLFLLEGIKTPEEFLERLRIFKQSSVGNADMYRSQRYIQYLRSLPSSSFLNHEEGGRSQKL